MHGPITTGTTPLTWYACTRHGRSGPGRCELCADERAVAANIAYLGSRIDALAEALHNATLREEALLKVVEDRLADQRQAIIAVYADQMRELHTADRVQQDRISDQDTRIAALEDQLQALLYARRIDERLVASLRSVRDQVADRLARQNEALERVRGENQALARRVAALEHQHGAPER